MHCPTFKTGSLDFFFSFLVAAVFNSGSLRQMLTTLAITVRTNGQNNTSLTYKKPHVSVMAKFRWKIIQFFLVGALGDSSVWPHK